MNLEILQKDKIAAMKIGADLKKQVLTDMIDAVQKAAITPKGRVDITDTLVDEVLIKYQKMVQEMIDTCPESRVQTMATYKAQMDIVKEYAPQLITDEEAIKQMIMDLLVDADLAPEKKNKGQIMKTVMPHLKGRVDMKSANQIIASMLQ